MRSWCSSVVERAAIVRDMVHRQTLLSFLESLATGVLAPMLWRLPPARLDAALDGYFALLPWRRQVSVEKVAHAALEALRFGRPFVRRGCLIRGLTLYCALRRAGIAVNLVCGMGGANTGDGFDGHCWVACEGEPLFEPCDPRCTYAAMYSLGAKPGRAPESGQQAA